MPEITFGESTTDIILEAFDMSVSEDGLVINDRTQEPVTDAFGDTVEIDRVGGIVDLESYGMSINNEGRIIDSKGDPISTNFDDDTYNHEETLVHVRYETAILRGGFSNLINFIEARRVHEEQE